MHASKYCLSATLCLALLAGCGDDDSGDSEDGAMSDAAFPEATCPEDVPEFAVGMEAAGEEGAITGRLIDAEYAPPRKFDNDWSVEFIDAAGDPIEDVEVTRAWSYMPVHGHEGSHEPMITALDEPGQFDAKNISLWMTGPWEVHFNVTSDSAGTDHVVFDVCIE